jgi:hypothetical protein
MFRFIEAGNHSGTLARPISHGQEHALERGFFKERLGGGNRPRDPAPRGEAGDRGMTDAGAVLTLRAMESQIRLKLCFGFGSEC